LDVQIEVEVPILFFFTANRVHKLPVIERKVFF